MDGNKITMRLFAGDMLTGSFLLALIGSIWATIITICRSEYDAISFSGWCFAELMIQNNDLGFKN